MRAEGYIDAKSAANTSVAVATVASTVMKNTLFYMEPFSESGGTTRRIGWYFMPYYSYCSRPTLTGSGEIY